MKILCLDPAGGSTGIAVIHLVDGHMSIPMYFEVKSPEMWDMTKKNNYTAHCVATIIHLEKPDIIVSENPWGAGFSKSSLSQLLGSIKAETWADIKWQGVSEARRGMIGDGFGSADKITSTTWLLEYPFSISAKKLIKSQLDTANKDGKIGYDILDALMHGVYYLVDNGLIVPVHKPAKKVRKKKNIIQE